MTSLRHIKRAHTDRQQALRRRRINQIPVIRNIGWHSLAFAPAGSGMSIFDNLDAHPTRID